MREGEREMGRGKGREMWCDFEITTVHGDIPV